MCRRGRCGSGFHANASTPGASSSFLGVLVIQRLTEGERHDKSRLTDILRLHGVST